MSAWIERLAQASDAALVVTAVLLLIALYNGFAGLRRVRQIEDVPTARVRSAPQAYVELTGTAHSMGGEPIIAPLSRTSCCWYCLRVEERSNNHWKLSRSETSDGIFLLRDDTGDCVIDPEGAEVTTEHKSVWFDDGDGWGGHGVHHRPASLGWATDTLVRISGKLMQGVSGSGRYRYTESVILDGDPLYAIGRFRTLGADHHAGSIHEMTGAILREWKRNPDTLRERFDRDRDGLIDAREWERARAVAEAEAGREYAEKFQQDQLHTLVEPGGGRYFLLSNLAEFGLLGRYRWRMRFGFAAFVLLGLLILPMLSSRLG